MDKTKAAARILIVEDNGIIAYSLRRTVLKLGYKVIGPVPSGEQAIQKAGEKCPDLVLMDINLAGKLNGVEAAAQIQAQLDIPVIYLTGYSEDVLLQKSLTTRPYTYLNKPVHERKLGDTIKKTLALE